MVAQPLKDRWRPVLLKKVEAGFPTNVWVQQQLGLTKERPQGHPMVTTFFRVAAALGTEITFILVLPLVFWVIDPHLGLRMVLLWGITYYIGQWVKDYFQLPRPTAPVIQLEAHYAEEYGLPSTHVMGGLTTPFYVWHYFYVQGAALWTLVFPLMWFGPISLSRLYLGAHSPLDCQAGFLLGVAIMLWWWASNVGSAIEGWMGSSAYVVEVAWLATFLALYLYPRPAYWVSSFGDTAIILGVVAGVVCGTYMAAPEVLASTPLYNHVPLASQDALTRTAARFCIGNGALVATRVVFKTILMAILPLVLPASDAEPRKRFAVEIPTKVITYAAVGVMATLLVPIAFIRLGI